VTVSQDQLAARFLIREIGVLAVTAGLPALNSFYTLWTLLANESAS